MLRKRRRSRAPGCRRPRPRPRRARTSPARALAGKSRGKTREGARRRASTERARAARGRDHGDRDDRAQGDVRGCLARRSCRATGSAGKARGRRAFEAANRFLFECSQNEAISPGVLTDQEGPKSSSKVVRDLLAAEVDTVDRVPSASPFLIERAPEAARPSRARPRDHDGKSSATLPASRTPRRCRLSAAQRAPGAPSRSLAVSRPARVFAHPPPLLSAQALTLYTRDADGSVKAVIAAKAGGLDLTVLPIAQYTGSADASQVRIAAIGSPKPRRRNPETRTRARCAKVSGEKDAGIACRMLFSACASKRPACVRRRLVPLTSGHRVNVSLFPLDPLSLKRRPPS